LLRSSERHGEWFIESERYEKAGGKGIRFFVDENIGCFVDFKPTKKPFMCLTQTEANYKVRAARRTREGFKVEAK
jgi:hypothetical protein